MNKIKNISIGMLFLVNIFTCASQEFDGNWQKDLRGSIIDITICMQESMKLIGKIRKETIRYEKSRDSVKALSKKSDAEVKKIETDSVKAQVIKVKNILEEAVREIQEKEKIEQEEREKTLNKLKIQLSRVIAIAEQVAELMCDDQFFNNEKNDQSINKNNNCGN